MPLVSSKSNLDPFRGPGSSHERAEPFVIALVERGVAFDWSSAGPVRALWLPEDFFGAFHRAAVQLRLPLVSTLVNLYARYRFNREDLPQLAAEFSAIEAHLSPPLSDAARIAAAFLNEAAASDRTLDAIIEGP